MKLAIFLGGSILGGWIIISGALSAINQLEKDGQSPTRAGLYRFEWQGHQYLTRSLADERAPFVHDPGCPCLTKTKP
jgi:hypothetical protein